MAENPKFTKRVTTSLTIKGIYGKDGTVITDDGMTYDIISLLQVFDCEEVKLTVKSQNDDE